jgi:MOSC domain-containing protein YiiM
MNEAIVIDSTSVGNQSRFLPTEALAAAMNMLGDPPRDVGSVALIVSRGEGGLRDTPDRVELTRVAGVAGDAWARRTNPMLDSQITAVQLDVAELIANGQPLTLFGDNLFLDLDLSASNLPIGSRVRVGTALLEVTSKRHKGCRKFMGRFGMDALRFISTMEVRPRRLRGIYFHVVEDGEAGPGDPVAVIQRRDPGGGIP